MTNRLTRLLPRLFLLTACFAPLGASAQFSLGVRGGMTVSDMRFADADFASSTGYSFGISMNYPLSRILSWQPEAMFVRKGFTVTVPNLLPSGAVDLGRPQSRLVKTLDYVEFPVLLKLDFPVQEARPFAMLGVAPAILVAESQSVEFGSAVPLANEFKTADVGVVFGGGADFRLGRVIAGIDVRYTFGLVDQVEGVRSRNRSFQLLGGLALLVD